MSRTERYACFLFPPTPRTMRDDTLFREDSLIRHEQIADAYLVALCQKNDGIFVTFDTGVNVGAVRGARPDLVRVLV